MIYKRTAEEHAAKLEAQKPQVMFAEAVVSCDDSILIRDLAKLITQNGKLGYKVPYIVGYSAFIGKQNGVFLYPDTINVGENLVPGVVIKTHGYFYNLYKRIDMALTRQNKVFLEIEN